MPSLSILAEPSVSVVDKVVQEKGAPAEVAKAYLEYLYRSDEGQEIAGAQLSTGRAVSEAIAKAKYAAQFSPRSNSSPSKTVFGSWANAQKSPLRRRRDI